MKLKSYQLNNVAQPSRQNQDWSNKFNFTTSQKQKFQPDTWVQLLELPSKYSFEEALLLCQLSPDEWVAWIPDHGEAVLKESQFCAVC
jgi:hypothetical protein